LSVVGVMLGGASELEALALTDVDKSTVYTALRATSP
jgi:hypothetical protein